MSEKSNFVWTDEEVTLLLSVVNDFKTQKAAEGIQKVQQASFQKVMSVRNSLSKKDCAAN